MYIFQRPAGTSDCGAPLGLSYDLVVAQGQKLTGPKGVLEGESHR